MSWEKGDRKRSLTLLEEEELSTVIFAHGFGAITDLKVGPDVYLSVLVYDKTDGRIFRVQWIKETNFNVNDNQVCESIIAAEFDLGLVHS